MNLNSLKIIGPKLWASVPNEAKNLPFQKNFSKYMKNLYINSLPTEMSSGRHLQKNPLNSERNKPQQIFLDKTIDEEFLGFDLSLGHIFNSHNDSNEDFYGFDLSLGHIFNFTHDSSSEFLGFS